MTQRIARGALFGLLATLAMTVVTAVGLSANTAPMPEPVSLAVARWALGGRPLAVLLGAGLAGHFAWGAAAGAVYAVLAGSRSGPWSGLAFGVALWLVVQVAVLPLVGWGAFGSAVTPRIAVATLVLHLLYGGVLGWGVAWHARRAAGTQWA